MFKSVRIIIFTVIATLCLTGCGSKYDVLGFVMPDPSVDFWNEVYKTMDEEAEEERLSLPDEITMDNFFGIFTTEGNASVGRYYIVKNIAGNMRVFINEHNGREQKIYRGSAPNEQKILNLLNNLHVRIEQKTDSQYITGDGDPVSSAELYIKENGVVYKVQTNNPFTI